MSHSADVFLVQPLPAIMRKRWDVSNVIRQMPPIGLLSIAAYLEHRGITVKIFDFNAYPDSFEDFQAALKKDRPSYLGITAVTASFNNGVRIAESAKAILPGIKVIFGGPHVSALKEQIIERFPVIDACVVGEGEETFYRYVSAAPDDAELLPGIVARTGDGEIKFNGYPDKLVDLDSLPFPAYHKLAGFPDIYRLPLFRYPAAPNTSLISSRGCPYACTYCDHSVFRRTFRYNSADYLYNHIKFLRERFRIRHVSIYDDQFTFNRQRVFELCEKLIRDPLRMTFNCTVRMEHIDNELLTILKRAGCWMISLGIESGDPNLLAQHRSSSDVDMLARRIRLIRRKGIRVMGLLMIGLPGETEASIARSMDYVFSLPINDFNLAKFTPFPGCQLYENARELGEFDEDWDRMDCMSFQFIPKGFTRERLERLFWIFYSRHFKRPKVWLDYFTMIWKSPDSFKRLGLHMTKLIGFAYSGSRGKNLSTDASNPRYERV